jgi:hypothetical protein
MLIIDPATRRFELYRSPAGAAVAVDPDPDGGLTLDSLGLRLLTVTTSDGPRLRVAKDTATTDC